MLGGEDETPRWADADLSAGQVLSGGSAAAGMLGTMWLPLGLLVGIAALLTLRHRRRAQREVDAANDAPLADGPAVLRGVVEPDAANAVMVSIEQKRYVFRDKRGRSHDRWSEKKRSVSVRPFALQLGDGRVVRVEPDTSVMLRDAVEAPEPVDENHRVRRARLRPGVPLWVTGVLSFEGAARSQGAYRDGATTAVLRPGRFARMVVSAEAPGAYDTARAGHHRGWVHIGLVLLGLGQGVLLCNVTAQTLSGRVETLTLAWTSSWYTWLKPRSEPGRWVRHCAVSGRAAPTDTLEEHEVRCTFQACVARGACRTLPTRRALLTADVLRTPGRGPVVHAIQLVFAGLLGWISLLVYWSSAMGGRPWYAGGSVFDPR